MDISDQKKLSDQSTDRLVSPTTPMDEQSAPPSDSTELNSEVENKSSESFRLSTPRQYSPVNRSENNIEELVTPVPTEAGSDTEVSSLLTTPSSVEVLETGLPDAAVDVDVDGAPAGAPGFDQNRPSVARDALEKTGRVEPISPGVIGRGVNAYTEWRGELRHNIESFRDWLREQKICDAQTEDRLDAMLAAIEDDKLHAAFVAEFSRGKSELINAVFFGDMDRRVLPSSAGRTTMCPTELLYDPDLPVGIRLLDIKTRLTDRTIADYKSDPEAWKFHAFDPDNAESVRNVLEVVTETSSVSHETASEMALTPTAAINSGSDSTESAGDPVNRGSELKISGDGMVDVPRWRHAIINYPHPLLEQGLVVLDTPGLNALGAEPELTLSMLAQAHAVVFILAADAGVTASDLAVWENHIRVRERASEKGKLVALNKIDFLWDELLSDEEIASEQDRMVRETAGGLAIPTTSIFPLSAQKALVGKIRNESELIEKSRIREFEYALANVLVPAKIDIVRDNVRGQLESVTAGVNAIVGQRLQDVDDHMSELEQLNSKNMQVIEDMMEKVRTDKDALEGNLHRFQSTRQVFTQQSSELYNCLSLAKLEQCIMETKRDMELSLTTPGLRSRIIRFFQQTENMLIEASAGASDIQTMMEEVYKSFQEENGLAPVQPRTFDIQRYQRELEELQESQNHFVNGVGVVFIEQKRLVRKFFDTVVFEVRQIFERCTRDADTWLKTIMSPMESQVREHQIQLRRRLESIKRIHQASDTLEDRVTEIEQFRAAIMDQQASMRKYNESLEKVLNRQLTEALLHDTAA